MHWSSKAISAMCCTADSNSAAGTPASWIVAGIFSSAFSAATAFRRLSTPAPGVSAGSFRAAAISAYRSWAWG
jgi:hypothetical protein